MLHIKFKAFLACVCAVACIVGFSQGAMLSAAADKEPAVSQPTTDLPAGNVVIENDALRFEFDQETCHFTVQNRENGYTWYSNPADWEEDPIAKGKYKQELATTLIVHYVNKNDVQDSSASYTGSVKPGNFKVRGIKNGVRIDFTFKYEGFVVPIELELKEDRLCARVIAAEIEETGTNLIVGIELLPYFGAGGVDDEGYIVVPDGSGAMIDFNNKKSAYTTYSQTVYGRDVNEALLRQTATTQQALLPVYGIKNGDNALLGVITENSSAQIMANVSGGRVSYNAARVNFKLRGSDTYTLGSTIGSRVKQITTYEEGGINVDRTEMSYFFLGKEECDYSGMAKRYREFLIDEGMLVAEKISARIFLEMYGGVSVRRPVMGFQTVVIQPITDYNAAKSMLEELKAAGVEDMSVRYVNWDNNTINSKAGGKVSLAGDLGGKKAFASLVAYCNENNLPLYLDQEMQLTNNWGNGYLSFAHGAQTISGTLAKKEGFSIQLKFKEGSKTSGLMSMPLIVKMAEKIEKTFSKFTEKYGTVGISTGSFGDTLYSDYRQTGWNRKDSEDVIKNTSASFVENGYAVMASGANLPSAFNAESLINVPVSSSRFDVENRSIPFYQLVFSGVKTYAASAANLSYSVDDMVLQAIETGSMVSFTLSEVDYADLKDTKFTTLYSIDFDKYKNDVVEAYKTLSTVYEKTEGSAIDQHTYVADHVAKTEYENGATVYVNYTDEDVTVDGVTIAAGSYTVKGGN